MSRFEAEPSYQLSVQTTGKRTTPDVSLNANPYTGYYVFDTTNGGWFEVGGTSASTPIWGAILAITNEGRTLNGLNTLQNAQADVYALNATTDFHDITSGSNGYSAKKGYDYVTGIGTPIANRVINDLVAKTASSAVQTAGSTGGPGSAVRPADADDAVVSAVPVEASGATLPRLGAGEPGSAAASVSLAAQAESASPSAPAVTSQADLLLTADPPLVMPPQSVLNPFAASPAAGARGAPLLARRTCRNRAAWRRLFSTSPPPGDRMPGMAIARYRARTCSSGNWRALTAARGPNPGPRTLGRLLRRLTPGLQTRGRLPAPLPPWMAKGGPGRPPWPPSPGSARRGSAIPATSGSETYLPRSPCGEDS